MSEQDPLLQQLQALPIRANEHDPAPKARDAFEKAFGRSTMTAVDVQPDGALVARSIVARSIVVRSIVPVFLAGVIAIYLLWAFTSVLALQG